MKKDRIVARSAAQLDELEKNKKVKKTVSKESSMADIATRDAKINLHRAKKLQSEGKESLAKELLKKAMKAYKSGAAKKIVKSVGKKLPIIGGIAAAAASGDVSAAIPVIGDSDDLGPAKGSPGHDIENPPKDPKKRKKQVQAILARMKKEK